jgi:hypothetical protein
MYETHLMPLIGPADMGDGMAGACGRGGCSPPDRRLALPAAG